MSFFSNVSSKGGKEFVSDVPGREIVSTSQRGRARERNRVDVPGRKIVSETMDQ